MIWQNIFLYVFLFIFPDQYISNLLRKDALNGYVEFLQALFFDCGWPPRMADIPIKVSSLKSID